MSYSGLTKITLLQISDIHYPESSIRIACDTKDTGFPSPLIHRTSPKPLQAAIRKIKSLSDDYKFDGMLICGDLTTGGLNKGYEDCIKYLLSTIGSSSEVFSNESLHVVPGNHDVDRPKSDKSGDEINAKFDAVKNLWRTSGFNVYLEAQARDTRITDEFRNSVSMISVNTCIGCGTVRYHSDKVQNAINKLFPEPFTNANMEKYSNLYEEHLDTPAFLAEEIDVLCHKLDKTIPQNSQAIVLAHHNILPQVVNQFGLYSQMINAGMARSRLLCCNRPILYLHGHIHDNLVEILTHPLYQHAKIVCIAAKDLENGFNVIFIEFTKGNIPIGCIVAPYLRHNDGSFSKQDLIRIPLSNLHNTKDISDVALHTVRNLINTDNPIAFPELIRRCDRSGIEMNRDTIADILLQEQWVGHVNINDCFCPPGGLDRLYTDPSSWIIRRILQ